MKPVPATPLNVALVAPVKLVPVSVTSVPPVPTAGAKLLMVGPATAGRVKLDTAVRLQLPPTSRERTKSLCGPLARALASATKLKELRSGAAVTGTATPDPKPGSVSK